MNSTQKSELCLWIVPSRSGKVKKFRFSLRLILVFLLSISVGVGTFLFVTGDYARVQILRIKNQLMLHSVTAERDNLISRTGDLNSELSSVKNLNSLAQQRERSIKEKLAQLKQVLEASPFLAFPDKQKYASPQGDKSKGIGGAEVDCLKDSASCEALFTEERASFSGNLPADSEAEGDLLLVLDNYLRNLKALPLGLPVGGEINSGFGFRRSPFHGGIRMHEGVDFALPPGSKIFVTAYGKVKRVERDGTYGLVVDVEHGPNLITRYAHMSGVNVVEGQRLERGDVLGYVGSTGRSTGPHLHYEVLVNNRAQNPKRFIEMGDALVRAVSSLLA